MLCCELVQIAICCYKQAIVYGQVFQAHILKASRLLCIANGLPLTTNLPIIQIMHNINRLIPTITFIPTIILVNLQTHPRNRPRMDKLIDEEIIFR